MTSLTSTTNQSHSERFFKYFQNETTSIQQQVERLTDPTLMQSERKNATDQCLAKITRLASEVADATGELPTYDQRTYNDAIRALQDKLVHIQSILAPKSKFSFKSKKNTTGLSLPTDTIGPTGDRLTAIPGYLTPGGSIGSPSSSRSATPVHLRTPDEDRSWNNPVPSAPPPPGRTEDDLLLPNDPDYSGSHRTLEPTAETRQIHSLTPEPYSLSISSHTNEYIIPPVSSSSSSSSLSGNSTCAISSLDSCVLNLSPPLSATSHKSSESLASLTLTNSRSTLFLLTRPISGPAHITNVHNSILVLSCRQFRMHDCENVVVYLFCSSRPIIEDCRGIRFARMPSYIYDAIYPPPTIDANNNISTSTTNNPNPANMFDQIDDFKWLKAEQSPNWSLLKPDEGIAEAMWKDLLTLKPDVKVKQTLNNIGIYMPPT